MVFTDYMKSLPNQQMDTIKKLDRNHVLYSGIGVQVDKRVESSCSY